MQNVAPRADENAPNPLTIDSAVQVVEFDRVVDRGAPVTASCYCTISSYYRSLFA
jgi:hypothetical protein